MATRTTIREAHNGRHVESVGDVVLLDEHPIWLDALEAVLSANGIRVTGKTTSPEAALELVESEQPDALVTSIDLPGSPIDGVDLLRRARRRWPDLRTVAFSTYDDPFHASAAATAGADAYLPKTADASEVAETIRTCLANGSHPRTPDPDLAKSPARPGP